MLGIIKKIKNILSEANGRGSILLFVMVFGSISFSLIVAAISTYAVSENAASRSDKNREQAFQIAEAGVAYYRWHLAHNPVDYIDSSTSTTNTPGMTQGPFTHAYKNAAGTVIGHYSLYITAPSATSTIVTVQATGWVDTQVGSKRTIKVKLGFPSLTDYSILTNAPIWIGNTEQTHGKFHSNGGIRFDGTADAQITSAMATYTCQTSFGCSPAATKPGIWGAGGPTKYWTFPQPAEDFNVITADLAKIKDASLDADGLYLSASGVFGWALTFTSSSKVVARKVNTVTCRLGADIGEAGMTNKCTDASTYSASTTYSMPANGNIFVEDNVWVDGTVRGRVVVGTAAGKTIYINGNILYYAKDGNHALGLIASKDIIVPYNSPNNLEIDAALLAQNGAAKRYYYGNNTTKNSITVYGSIITNNIWTWSWNSPVNSGYINTNSTYDANLTYSPPPGFPVGSEYNQISWEEVKNP